MNGQTDKVNYRSVVIKIKGLCLLKHDRQTDGQNNLLGKCAYVKGIFTKNFSNLSLIFSNYQEKIRDLEG